MFTYFHGAFNFRWNDTTPLLSTRNLSREGANVYPTEETKLIFLSTVFWGTFCKSFVSFIPRSCWQVNAPRGAIYSAPIGSYSNRTWFPDDSYLTNGKECVARFSRRSWGRTRDESLRESAWEAKEYHHVTFCRAERRWKTENKAKKVIECKYNQK